MSDSEAIREPDGKTIAKMMLGFQTTQVLYSACALGVFEQLHTSLPLTAQEVSNKLSTDPDATERLMNACAGLGLLLKQFAGKGTATFRNSSVAEIYLVRSSPMSMYSMLVNIGDLYPLWGRLREGVQEGRSQLAQALGGNGNIFETGGGYFATKTKQTEFLQVMHIFSSIDAPSVLREVDLSEFSSICDLGGCTGALAVQVARMYPEASVSVFDLDHVVAAVRQFLPDDKPKNLIFQAGDFFKEPLPSADLYILSHVIHDWDAKHVDILLNKIYTSLSPGGALLVLEKMLNESKDGPVQTLIFDIGMLIGAEGRERTSTEYIDLLEGHGFQDCHVKLISTAQWRDAVLARKH